MKKIFDIFRIRREERWLALVVLVALLACYSGMGQLTTLSLLLYEGFWILASLLVPRFHKP